MEFRSPTYPQSNGKVEAAVKSAKSVMKKSRKAKTDPYLALLEYRNTPSRGGSRIFLRRGCTSKE